MYYYCRNTNNEYPNYVTSTVSRTLTTSANSCPSKIGTPLKGRGFDLEHALLQYDEWNTEYEFWLAKLLAFESEDGEEYSTALNWVSHYSALKDNYFNSIIVAAMSKEEEKEKGEKEKGEGAKFLLLCEEKVADGDLSPDDGRGDNDQGSLYENLRYLFSYRNHYHDNLSITETHLAENNFTEALTTLSKIYVQFKITEEQAAELQAFELYINWLQQLETEQKTIYNLPEKELNYLVNFVETRTGRSVVFANNILCELYNICIEGQGEGSRENGESGERFLATLGMTSPSNFEGVSGAAGRGSLYENITLYPNPTTGELRIENGELRIKSVGVFDVYGRNLLTSFVSQMSPETTINLAHLPAGIYFVKVKTETGEMTQKVIKH